MIAFTGNPNLGLHEAGAKDGSRVWTTLTSTNSTEQKVLTKEPVSQAGAQAESQDIWKSKTQTSSSVMSDPSTGLQ